VGNLILMRLLIGGAHLPVLASNLIAILCCSVANFAIGNSWAFASASGRLVKGTASAVQLRRPKCLGFSR